MTNSQFLTECDVDCLEGKFMRLNSVWMMDGLEDELTILKDHADTGWLEVQFMMLQL